jgi:hypothetical protein
MGWMKGFEREGEEEDLEIRKTAGNCTEHVCVCTCMYRVG